MDKRFRNAHNTTNTSNYSENSSQVGNPFRWQKFQIVKAPLESENQRCQPQMETIRTRISRKKIKINNPASTSPCDDVIG